jgi:hypothetical protein
MRHTQVLAVTAVVTVALLGVACGGDGDPTTPTGPTGVPFVTEYFSGAIDSGGTRFYSFTVTTSGPVTVTLASISNADTGLPLGQPLRVGVGRPSGTDCAVDASAVVTAGLVNQLTHIAPSGVNCIDVTDTVGLPGPIFFALRFTHP